MRGKAGSLLIVVGGEENRGSEIAPVCLPQGKDKQREHVLPLVMRISGKQVRAWRNLDASLPATNGSW